MARICGRGAFTERDQNEIENALGTNIKNRVMALPNVIPKPANDEGPFRIEMGLNSFLSAICVNYI